MRPFWRSFWASIFAYVVLSAFIILIINIVVFTVAGSFMSSEEFKISENSYLEMDLNFNIKERGGIETTNDINNPISKSFGVNDVISWRFWRYGFILLGNFITYRPINYIFFS